MRVAPALHSRDLLGCAEIVLVFGLGEPPALTGRLARLTTRGTRAIALASHVARIGPEQRSATQALTLSLAFHGPALLGLDHAPPPRRDRPQAGHPRRSCETPRGSTEKAEEETK